MLRWTGGRTIRQEVARVIVTHAPPAPVPPTASPARPATAPTPASRGIAWPRPTVPRISARAAHALSLLLRPSKLWYAVALQLERHPRLYRLFREAERVVKGRLFGCKMCAQCALPSTVYSCPMTCPKQLRNGPCGGVSP
ncbi:MAG: methylenetetrahydrofolate reductase C-terminal domain-containing protein, partial [Chloroflexi bacterium]|nr:methylenetetrahydrofolate reductase C-terminal domain-containing protein [Chloroflexota bacterium]